METYLGDIDDVPTADSSNLVKSSGVFDLTKYVYVPKKSSIIEKVQNWNENNYISANTNKWRTSNYAKSTIFNITGYKHIRINLLDDSCQYAFLKSLSFESETTPDYATNSRITIITDIAYIDLQVLNDAQYLYVLDKYNENLYRTNIESSDVIISLQYAISLIPEERQVGYLTIKFLDEDNKVSIYQLQTSYWSTDLTKWKKILDLDDLTTINEELSDIKRVTGLIEIPDIPTFYYNTERVDLDYPIQGYYSQNANDEQIIISTENARSTPIITVKEGSIIKLHNWTFNPSSQIIAAYDLDNLPYDGNSCRINGSLFTDLGDGEYEYILSANVEKISILVAVTRINLTDGAYFEILNPSGQEIILDDKLKEAINDCVDIDNSSATDYVAEMYHKGASPKSYNAQKDLGIIIAGQSNAAGRAPIEDLQTQIEFPISNVHFCNNSDGTFRDYNRPSTRFGFDLTLLNQVGAIDNIDVYGIKYAIGGTSISDKTAKTSVWTVFYERAIADGKTSLLRNLESGLRNALTNNSNVEIRAFCWHQGESDGNYSLEVANDYCDNLRYLVSYVRGVVGNSRLPFIFGNISLNASSTVQYIDIINAAFDRIVETDPYAMLVDMKGAPLKSDNLHFNAASQEYLGKMMHDCLIDMGVINATKVNPIRPW